MVAERARPIVDPIEPLPSGVSRVPFESRMRTNRPSPQGGQIVSSVEAIFEFGEVARNEGIDQPQAIPPVRRADMHRCEPQARKQLRPWNTPAGVPPNG
jgi:hypothetical protein